MHKLFRTAIGVSALALVLPAHAVVTSYRISGDRYILRVLAQTNDPVDCQLDWQVRTTAGLTRQGSVFINNVPGNSWNEALGPLVQDADPPAIGARCQLSDIERTRRAQEQAQVQERQARARRLEEERRLAAQRQAELRQQAALQQQLQQQQAQQAREREAERKAEAASQDQSRGNAQQAAREREQQERVAAQQRQAMLEEQRRVELQRRTEQQRRAEQEAQERERLARQKAAELQQRRAALGQSAMAMSGSMSQQAATMGADIAQIAGAGQGRVAEMAREAPQGDALAPVSGEAMRSFLLGQVDLPAGVRAEAAGAGIPGCRARAAQAASAAQASCPPITKLPATDANPATTRKLP